MAKEITIEQLLSSKDPKAVVAALPFEQAIRLLEELVVSVESGSLPLDQAIDSYEKGVAVVEHLRALLNGAEEKLKVLQARS